MSVESILRHKGTDVATIRPEASIKSAADWLRAKNIGALVVTSGDAVLGLISEREIVHAFARYGETIGSMPVKDIMRYGVTTVSADESVNRVMNLMTHHRVRHMLVLRDGRLAGIISIGDVSSIVWKIWSSRRTSCATRTTPRVDASGVVSAPHSGQLGTIQTHRRLASKMDLQRVPVESSLPLMDLQPNNDES
jgi:CBS domain-containing protein